ncbi:MAG: serine hydrolase domain-containing protein [Dehalococcoidia bacterium]|jgi:CubicO group peptidase (beta-lactamase class C family)|nr:serine hydrolase [Chloroflexota bacterium]MDP7090020.1 serine hydrolase domain-containing protein [Dehalococcoidia bacterium]
MTAGMSSERLQRIDQHFQEKYIDAGKLPGVLTLVARRGEIVHFSTLGKIDIEQNKPTEKDTIYRIYSMTKAITSVALMMLYEEGRFQLGDPVHQYLPEWKNTAVWVSGDSPNFTTRPQDRPMTIRDLLTHQSGLSYGFSDDHAVDRAYQQVDREEMMAMHLPEWSKKASEIPLLFSPGTAWEYSVATDLCGYLVQVISGQNFDDFLSERIFEPLGMVDTSFGISDEKIDRFASLYVPTLEGGLKLQDSAEDSYYRKPINWISGGGGLLSTAMDYYRFLQVLANRGVAEGCRYLSRKTIDMMTANHLPDGISVAEHANREPWNDPKRLGEGFGLGFAVTLSPEKAQIVGSQGQYSWRGAASTEFWIDPKEELVVIFMTQLMGSGTYPLRQELQVLVNAAIDD